MMKTEQKKWAQALKRSRLRTVGFCSPLSMTEPAFDRSGSILVVLDVPQGVEFGIDCITYETGHKFKGMSMVPQGLHFLYHGAGMGDRQGFFIFVEPNSVVVKTWDSSQEQILPRHSLSDESLESLHIALARGELNTNLGPYPYQQHHTWQNISNFITTSVLNRSECSVECLLYPGDDSDLLVVDPNARERQQNGATSDTLKAYFPGAARVARFVDLQRLELELIERLPAGPQRAAAVTANMLDKSNLLEHMVRTVFGGSWAELLGELQLAFVLFMMLYSHPALEHWKRLVYAICSSERYLQTAPDFTAAFLRILFSQLNFAPTDFFENELSTQNFLRPSMTALFASLSGPEIGATLLEHKRRLRTFIQKKFNLYETEVFTSVSESGAQVRYDEEDLYNISEEDLPTFVSAEELRQYGAAEYQAATRSMDAMGDMNISGEGAAQRAFTLRDHSASGTGTATGTGSDPSGQTSESTFHARWAQIDTALDSTPARSSAGGAGGAVGGDADTMMEEDSLGRLADSRLQAGVESAEAKRQRDHSVGCSESKTGSDMQVAETVGAGEGMEGLEGVAGVPAPMTPAEREAALFGWRYPLLYESMMLTAGREDMVMSAMRIVEESGHLAGSGDHGSIAVQRYREAARFVEYEIGGHNG